MARNNTGAALLLASQHSRCQRLLFGAVLLAGVLGSALGHAGELIVYSTNIAPFFYSNEENALSAVRGEGAGAVNELLNLAARETDVTLDIRALPFRRLTALLNTRPQTLAVMWRLPEVENTRVWLAKLLSEQLVVLLRSDSVLNPKDLTSLRNMHIGVVLGGPAEVAVRRLGLTDIETASTAESNARKLAIGRIDAWVAFRSVADVTQRQIGSSMKAVRVGAVLQNMDLYLTCGSIKDEREVSQWKSTFMRLRKEGLQQSLLQRYDLALGPDTR
ncbi:ABC transporter substrate-binding protein [Rugamonas sp.]|uniref:substrate-binding periplasmic protein n=1 Tax=Rugamonas sp. TaxID=1926287 RepID=UPI002601347B|nr:transporter substrate-binding domain-containing protein [Rugamonas sp.]